jgi:putative integral membrane protein (TIGR02587 family)
MSASDAKEGAERKFLLGVTRAFGGALVFSLPMLMTMEMWELGFAMHRLKLAMLVLTLMPLLHGLAYFCGFEDTRGHGPAALDALVAFAVACITATCTLGMLGLLARGMSTGEIVAEIVVQAVPGSFGALLAQSQFGIKKR